MSHETTTPSTAAAHLLVARLRAFAARFTGAFTRQLPAPITAGDAAVLVDYIDALTARVREVEALANRWMRAALYVVPIDAIAFDPMSPEAFAESRRQAVDEIMAERDALRAQLTAATARAAHTGLMLQQRVTQTRLHSESVNGNCTSACLASVFGGDIEAYDVRIPFTPDWWSHVEAIFREHGLLVLQISPVDGAPAGTSFMAGVSPRGVRHLCVAQDGAIVHDPHPSRDGLTEITDYWVAIPWLFPSDSALAIEAQADAAGEGKHHA